MLNSNLRALKDQWSSLNLSDRSPSIQQQGFALPLALGVGLVLLTLATTTVLLSQKGQTTAWQRRESGVSLATAEGGMARMVAQLKEPNNAILLTRNYDRLNPNTNTTYLGADGIPRSGDEESTAVDNWTGYATAASSFCGTTTPAMTPSMILSGTMGASPENNGQYELVAYRYNSLTQEGTLLVEGRQDDATSYVAMTVSIEATLANFPGILSEGYVLLRGRQVSGKNGNIYYRSTTSADPTLTGSAAPWDATRPDYLNAIYSTTQDGASADSVSGNITACDINLTLPSAVPAGATTINTLQGNHSLSTANSPYQINHVDLRGTDLVTVDTTNGPVEIYVTETFALHNTAQLRNVRTDNQPPQVGDLRIYMLDDGPLTSGFYLFDQTCIDTAYLYSTSKDLHLQGTGDGCPSSGNSNIDGVVWVEDVVNSINIAPNPRTAHHEDDTVITTDGETSGIAVPSDISSLADQVSALGMVPTYRIGYIKIWQRVRL